jgi:hypothetical protein
MWMQSLAISPQLLSIEVTECVTIRIRDVSVQ